MNKKIFSKFIFITLIGHLFFVCNSSIGEDKKGFFKFTRTCVANIDEGDSSMPPCITSMTGAFALDIFLSPFQTFNKIINAFEGSQDSENSKNSTSSSSSSSKRSKTGEVPEERKVLNRLSLFHLVADDAQDYLASGATTPLLLSAIQAMDQYYPVTDINLEVDSKKIQSLRLIAIEQKVLNLLETME